MTRLFNIPTVQQLANIANMLNEELTDVRKDNVSITFELDKDLLRQIDEDQYFKNNKDDNAGDFTPSDEIEIIVLGIKFKFIERINDNQET